MFYLEAASKNFLWETAKGLYSTFGLQHFFYPVACNVNDIILAYKDAESHSTELEGDYVPEDLREQSCQIKQDCLCNGTLCGKKSSSIVFIPLVLWVFLLLAVKLILLIQTPNTFLLS